ncbi:MAG: response regulator transcription factor [Acidobacteria bacterium]|nr:response regulator transcription factor [Acidobacteriota bacterium]
MKVLIVDDEPIARQILREYLEEMPGIEIAGEAGNGLEAVECIARLKPDVLLLDLQMPEMDGFTVARNLAGRSIPVIVYVTAFQDHALQAFETGAVDYLLKPVRPDRLAAALEKARTQVAGHARPARAAERPRKIAGRMGEQVHLLDPADVVAFQADGEVVYVFTATGRYFANSSLRALEEKLDPAQFRRVHRKTLINTDHIRTISPLSSKRWLLKMSNGIEVTVSKRLAGLIREQASW